MKKMLHRAFALLLTASFLFTMASPAFATSVAEDTFLAYSMPADIVTSSLINGIGVLPGNDVQVYEGVVQRCVNYLTDLGRVVDGKIDVWKREQVGENSWKYGADISLVEVIRSWLFDNSGSVSYTPNASSTHSYTQTINSNTVQRWTISTYATSYFYGATQPDGRLAIKLCSLEPNTFTTYLNGNQWIEPKSFTYKASLDAYFASVTVQSAEQISGVPVIGTWENADALAAQYVGGGTISVSDGLTAGFIAPGSVVFGDAYPDWYRNIATIPLPGATSPDDDIKALPFAPGQTLGDTLTIPQEDVWTGSGSYVDAPSVPDTVTLSDVLTAILSIPASIVEAIGNLFFPAVDGLTMSLSDFFPFCIPYDLFELFTLLQAEPEAPKFEWKIPVPQLGRTFEVEVDLSAWDEVAQLFRNLELLAFIVGLAYVTREKFLRS